MDLMVLAMARKYMDKKVAELVSAGWTKEIVKELPTTGNDKTIYMVEKTDYEGNIYYDEYMYTNGRYDAIGTTKTDLSGYAQFNNFNPYHFSISGGYINILKYDPNDDNTRSGFVGAEAFNDLNFRVSMLEEKDDSDTAPLDYVLLNDKSTSKTYKLYVDNGKLSLELQGGTN